jgi:hypothetical protein
MVEIIAKKSWSKEISICHNLLLINKYTYNKFIIEIKTPKENCHGKKPS